jgi:hypothetical protein
MVAVLAGVILLNRAENPASHENMRVGAMIRLDLIETFIHPVYAILAVNHDKQGDLIIAALRKEID